MQEEGKKQEVLAFIDWLGLSVRLLSDPLPVTGFTWREYTATNVWGKRMVLYTDEGDRVLTLLYSPRSSIISSNAGLVEIENEWLYHGKGTDGILQTLMQSVFFEILGISRLDLCVDFNPTNLQSEIIEGLASGNYYVQGKQNGSGFWSTNKNPKVRRGEEDRIERLHPYWVDRRIPHCQSWGHKTSDIKWKLYYKTKELLDDGGGKFMAKPYIIDQWRMASMDVRNVWRLEVSMKHLNNYNLYGEHIGLDELREKWPELFLSMYGQRFVVRKNEGHIDKSNDEVVPFLPVQYIGKQVTRADSKKLADHSGRITLLRHLVTSLEDEHVLLDDTTRRDVFEHITKVVRRDNLGNYFKMMTGNWLDEFIENKEREAITAFEGKSDTTVALYMAKKGSTVAERRIDVVRHDKTPLMRPNERFEQYDGEGMPLATGEGITMKKMQRPRATVQYTFPIVIKFPPSGRQGCLLP